MSILTKAMEDRAWLIKSDQAPGGKVTLATVAFVFLGSAHALPAQSSLGGCDLNASGSYYARVTQLTSARELNRDRVFGILQVGDEVRVCRVVGRNATITIQQPGVGFAVDKSALTKLPSWTRKEIARRRRNCIARAIDDIQASHGVDEQTRQLLVLARTEKVSFFQLLEIRMDPYPRGPCANRA